MRTWLLIFMVLSCCKLIAQPVHGPSPSAKKQRITLGSGVESNLFQLVYDQKNLGSDMIPRYTYFFNTGIQANLHLNKHWKIFSGANLRNIGLIMRFNDSIRQKHRVYTLGLPLGLKWQTREREFAIRAGVDLSMALHYKWKLFVNDQKTVKGQYFSKRTAQFMPSGFFGISIKGVSITANYYPNNFFNPNHIERLGWDARLVTLGLGFEVSDYKWVRVRRKSPRS